MELSQKIALVTGGARGIGAACVLQLLQNGVAVSLESSLKFSLENDDR